MELTAPSPAAELHPDVLEVLISEEQLRLRVAELGAAISRDYAGRDLHLVCVLRGALLFVADLMRAIRVPHSVDFISISSYGSGTRSSGVVRIVKDLEDSIESRHVLVVEDIVDSGLTLSYLLNLLRDRNVASLEVCTLLDKPNARKADLEPRYVGFEVPEAFVVGYGLDYNQGYRGLPYIGILKPDVYGGG
ncbi:MAG: hypoxanthine phosphoribosyltransferase [Armatimonadetes bacterium]|jgi:hypoxanthine phosphoribosyltransferase|nr:hypoxanthine phosphoribosyltransferase [Armatimonadota bacterium]